MRLVFVLGLLLLFAGCRSVAGYGAAGDGAAVDGAAVDGAAVDGAAVDGAAVDGVAVDGVAVDGVAVDGGPADGTRDRLDDRFRDRSLRDASDALTEVGLPSDGSSDAGPSDAPPPDAGPDARPPDATPTDGPVPDAPSTHPLPQLVNCGSGTWCWEHPKPQGNNLYGLFCASSGDCYAVGDAGTLLHRPAGGTWQLRQSDTQGKLRAVWVDEATGTIVVVGGEQIGVWTNTWTYTPHGDHPDLVSVWGLSATEFYVGSAPDAIATRQGIWRFATDTNTLTKLDAGPGLDLWGDGTKVYALTPGGVKEMDGTSALAADYASFTGCPVAVAGTIAFTSVPNTFPPMFLVLRSNQEILHLTPTSCGVYQVSPVAGGNTISAVSSNEVFLGSDKGIHHFLVGTGGWQSNPYVSAAAVNRLVPGTGGPPRAVGDLGGLYQATGTGWQEESSRLTTRRLWSAAMVAGALFAAGENSTLLEQTGGTWVIAPSIAGSVGHVYALAGTATELRAIDAAGEFISLRPLPVVSTTIAPGHPLFALRAHAGDYLVGGHDTLLLCSNIAACSGTPYGAYTGTVRALQLAGSDLLVASSDETSGVESPRLVRINSNGQQFPAQLVDTMGLAIPVPPLYALWGSGAEVRAVGHGGTVLLRGNNDTWTVESTPSDAKGRLRAIAGRNSSELWAVGEGGMILSRNGVWNREPFVTRQGLYGLAVDQYGHAWAVGAGGAILHYTP